MEIKKVTLNSLFGNEGGMNLTSSITLIKKMISMGFQRGCLQWISFINLRTQRTRVYNQSSAEIEFHFRDPQGTVLGSLLFLLKVNEGNIPHAQTYEYVDDMTPALAH